MTLPKGNLAVENGRVTASEGFYETSDARKKTVFSTLGKDTLHYIDTIPTVRYYLNDDPCRRAHIGTIAQEIRVNFPECVTQDEEGYLSVDYGKMSIVAIRGV